jgi:vanillate O-demethylase monooxygenase subunit
VKTAKTNYPKKCWYVAATCDEIAQSPLGRRLLGEEVVLWRGASGRVVAFVNRCAHRAFPLSHSRIDGDRLVCGYHGCTYDIDGKCVHIPSQPQVPTGMRVRVFPVIEEPPFVWIWLGPPAAAPGSEPPRVPWVNDPAWSTFADAWQVSANYMMIHEHYLDFSYAPILHATETTVSYTRLLPDASMADWEADATGLDRALTYKRRERGTFASPAMHFQSWEVASSSDQVHTTTRIHGITPETETSSHVFMQSARNYRLNDDAVTDRLRSFLAEVARRDISTLEMASNHSGYDMWRGGVEFQADAAILRARRIVGVMLAKEAGRSAIRPGLAPNSRGGSLNPIQPVTASG